jgi:hypothetical protein
MINSHVSGVARTNSSSGQRYFGSPRSCNTQASRPTPHGLIVFVIVLYLPVFLSRVARKSYYSYGHSYELHAYTMKYKMRSRWASTATFHTTGLILGKTLMSISIVVFQTCASITPVMYKFLLIFPHQGPTPPSKKEKNSMDKNLPLGYPTPFEFIRNYAYQHNTRPLNPMVRSTQKRSLTRRSSSSSPANVRVPRRLTGSHRVKI